MYVSQTVEDVLAALGASRDGLSAAEAEQRLGQYGFNEIPKKRRSLVLLFLRQFRSVLVYILLAALLLSLLLPIYENASAGPGAGDGALTLSDFLDALAIGAILILNACLGFFQEKKAENAIAVLRQMSEPHVRARRSGFVQIIPSRDLVPGDILLLEEGDRVSADGRVVFARHAAVDEAALTGESKPSRKRSEALPGTPGIADQANMVFRGTTVTAGHLEVCVTATGMQSELGRIAKLVTEVDHPPTPLERSMARLGRWLGSVVLVFCGVIFLVGVLRDLPVSVMLLAAASLAVSAVPEGLPAIVTVCLALGVRRMIGRRVLTRELSAIETLGSVTVICTDKTGTITENEMEAQELWVDGREMAVQWGKGNATVSFRHASGACADVPRLKLLLEIGASCNNAHSLDVGDPTEIGLLEVAEVAGVERLPIVEEEVPFCSERRYMVTTHRSGMAGTVPGGTVPGGADSGSDSEVRYIKGAPEVIVEMCDLSQEEKQMVLHRNEDMAKRALRVLAMAYRDNESGKGFVFVGLVGLMDPPRDGVKEAVMLAKRAGIRTVIITGDHAATAKAIAAKVGVVSDVVAGGEIAGMDEGALEECVRTHAVFARVSPDQKVRILDGLQRAGEVVAMGGDGVNDAPALKKAHVGFAMGQQGTDVARDTADIVLTDDNYVSVVGAVEEGRTIYDNIRKFVTFLLRANFDELAVVLGAILIGIPLPYLPIHILLINLATDSLPAMALAVEKPEPNIMERPPRDPREHILHGEFFFIFLAATVATVAAFHVFFSGLRANGGDVDTARSMTVATAILFELTLVFACRSRRSLLSIGPFSNRSLLAAVGIAFALFLLSLYSPLNVFLRLVPLTVGQWILPVLWSFGALAFFEVLKVLPRTGRQR